MENYTPYHRMLNVFTEIEKETQKKVYLVCNKSSELKMRKNYCEYYLYFTKAFIFSENKKFGLESLTLAQKNDPLNLKVYFYYLLIVIPYFLYPILIKMYKKLKHFKNKIIYSTFNKTRILKQK